MVVNTILPADLRSGQSSELWTSGDHGEGNEVKGRRGSREWRKGGGREGGKKGGGEGGGREGGCSECTAGWDAPSRMERHRYPQKIGEKTVQIAK